MRTTPLVPVKLVFILIAFLYSCSDNDAAHDNPGVNAMFRGNSEHLGNSVSAPFSNVTLTWTTETQGAIRGSVAVDGSVLFVGSADHHVYALERNTGHQLWKVKTEGAIQSTPAIYRDAVIISSRDLNVYALKKGSGEILWKFKTGELLPHKWGWEYFVSSPTVVNESVIIGGGDGLVYSLDASTGKENWRFKTAGRVRSSAAVKNGIVYIGSFDSYLYALDLRTGELKWKFETDGTKFDSDASGWDRNSIDSSPAVTDSLLVFGSRDGNVYALNSQSGKLKWKFTYGPTWAISSPAIVNNTVYIGWSDNFIFCAIDIATGKEKWKYECKNYVYSSPVVTDSIVYVGSHDRSLYAFNTNTGKKIWQYRTNGSVYSSPVIEDSLMYVGSDDGSVYAFTNSNKPTLYKAVYLQNDQKYWTVDPRLVPYLSSFGYTSLDTLGLERFLKERISDKHASVIVLGSDRVPEFMLQADGSTPGLIRQYLDAGGKIVSTGNIPTLYEFDSEGNILRENPELASKALDMKYDITHDWGSYTSSVTETGAAWGLAGWWVNSYSVPPQEGVIPLATNECGRPSSWVKNFGGGEGTGFVQFRTWEVGRMARDNELELIRKVAEYGF